ncbi:MAG: 3-deoxy-8-phosphooctulonate synthase, partial [Pyrinomonadaceae bacterium]|nr:3-deoxy-8-phosphooctulonate synthase [Pyrinomonadaceae bacterium]
MNKVKPFEVENVTFGDGRLTIIAGPCVIETQEHALMMAREIKAICNRVELDFVYKSSFDKANRSSSNSFRGNGLQYGLEILKVVKDEIKVPIITDVHETSQVESVAQVVDIIQIPAFLCRQTDLLIECAKSGKAVNVKKGQFLAPNDAKNIVDKMRDAGCEKL